MKKSIISSETILKIKNIWFGCQLFIVAVSLPVISAYQIAHTANRDEVKTEQNLTHAKTLVEELG